MRGVETRIQEIRHRIFREVARMAYHTEWPVDKRKMCIRDRYEIYCIINQLAAEGKSVIMISSELPEVLGMSDRIYIMNEGRMAGEVNAGEATQEYIMSCILKSDKGE